MFYMTLLKTEADRYYPNIFITRQHNSVFLLLINDGQLGLNSWYIILARRINDFFFNTTFYYGKMISFVYRAY